MKFSPVTPLSVLRESVFERTAERPPSDRRAASGTVLRAGERRVSALLIGAPVQCVWSRRAPAVFLREVFFFSLQHSCHRGAGQLSARCAGPGGHAHTESAARKASAGTFCLGVPPRPSCMFRSRTSGVRTAPAARRSRRRNQGGAGGIISPALPFRGPGRSPAAFPAFPVFSAFSVFTSVFFGRRRGYWGGGWRRRGRRTYRKLGTCRSRHGSLWGGGGGGRLRFRLRRTWRC